MTHQASPSWVVVTDAPEDLNFAMYVAAVYDILPNQPPYSHHALWPRRTRSEQSESESVQLRQQWHQWWTWMISEKASNVDANPRGGELWSKTFTMVHEAHDDLFQRLGPLLAPRCQSVLDQFQSWWTLPAGGQFAINYWSSQVPIGSMVKQTADTLHRPIHPFRLTVHFVYLGLEEIIEAHSHYAVMSIHQPGKTVGNLPWWREKIRALA